MQCKKVVKAIGLDRTVEFDQKVNVTALLVKIFASRRTEDVKCGHVIFPAKLYKPIPVLFYYRRHTAFFSYRLKQNTQQFNSQDPKTSKICGTSIRPGGETLLRPVRNPEFPELILAAFGQPFSS